jgi:hypothetical protein
MVITNHDFQSTKVSVGALHVGALHAHPPLRALGEKRKIRQSQEDIIKSHHKIMVKRRSLIQIKIIRHALQITKIDDSLEKYFQVSLYTLLYL